MTDTQFTYDELVQNALKGVVKEILQQVEKNGLQNEHHFYIAINTQAEGVDLPAHLIERYPDEMTIVLQHRFWGLKVMDDHFEVGLSFGKKPQHLKIPFDAIVTFVDPSAQFALQFEGDTDLAAISEIKPSKEQIPGPEDEEEPEAATVADQEAEGKGDANVVALDSFRQK